MSQTRTETSAPTTEHAVVSLVPDGSSPTGKLADVELAFTPETEHLFYRLKIAGFIVWNNGVDGLGVEMPSRQFQEAGEDRSYNLLRVAGLEGNENSGLGRERAEAFRPLRTYIVDAYRTWCSNGMPAAISGSCAFISKPDPGAPPAKLADVSLAITPDTGWLLHGLKLVGFGLWEDGLGISVQMPNRPVWRNGAQRPFFVLRAIGENEREREEAYAPLKTYILTAHSQRRSAE